MSNFLQKKANQTTIRQDVGVALFLGVSVFLVLVIFQPFGTYNFQDTQKTFLLSGYGLVIGVGYFVAARSMRLLFPKWHEKENWTFGKELLSVLMVFLMVLAATYFYRNIALGYGYSWYGFFYYMGLAASTSIFPMSIIFLIRYMQLKNKPTIIYQPVAEIQPTSLVGRQNIYISVEGENKNEKLKFSKEELLFVKASDNYVVIHLNKDGKVAKHMLRSSLSKLAGQIDDPDILQVHRSYLVNMENVQELAGKSPNYILQLKSLKEEIPVSRTKVKSLRELLQEKPL